MKCYAPIEEGEPLQQQHTRPFFVIDSLDTLSGPGEGIVTLPVTIDWGPAPTHDLSNPTRLRTLYRKVLTEGDEAAIAKVVHARTLHREWPALRLPTYVRQAWEAQHPSLTQRA